MSARAFIGLVVGLALALWLATTPVGAMFGFFVGIAIAFFIAPVVLLSGLPGEAWTPALWVLGGLHFVGVLYYAVRGRLAWSRGDRNDARRRWSIALTPIVLWSNDALQQAWP